ncbi:GNAT family N-acetyltransferase [Actinotalea sp. AC32]|nr:GNAT family N-acetyltransferase [Actinotalea sp. AC32]
MTITLTTPDVAGLPEVVAELAAWQHDDAPMQLHPGDVGWAWRFGAEETAAAVRTWSRGGRVLAVALQNGPTLLRVTTAPDLRDDAELAERLLDDVTRPERGVAGPDASVDVPSGTLLGDLLRERGWTEGEPWTPLRRDLAEPVEDPGVRVETVGPRNAPLRTAVQRAAFERSTFTDERWRTMAAGAPYADARCLVAFDDDGAAVAAVTVWSAGVGRPGLVEPMGVHRDHRGRGHGRGITVAGAAALRELGSSSALVATPTGNAGAVATYVAAGFAPRPETHDLCPVR